VARGPSGARYRDPRDGLDREQALQFFKDNAPKAEQDIVVEVDRYIAWPGQALAYKIGQLKFRELRDSAAAA